VVSTPADPFAFVSAAPWPASEAAGIWFAFRGRELLVLEGSGLPRGRSLAAIGLAAVRVQMVGHLRGEACFSAELPPDAQPPAGAQFRGLRELHGQLAPELMTVAGRAVQIMEWDRTHRFCGACGSPTAPDPRTRSLVCTDAACALAHYPRLSPVVIVSVERGPEILLARSPRFAPGIYSVVAGFVDPGESAEDAVHREVFEETGVRVANLRYFASQAWPFPHSLMLGFQADYAGGEVRPDGDEIEAAGFFHVDALPRTTVGRVSISQWLIHDFRRRHARVADSGTR
jgi:NAD+ diphosphatase